MPWVRLHHSHLKKHVFHVTVPFEVWLEEKLNEMNAEYFDVVVDNPDVKVVMVLVPDNNNGDKHL